MKKSAALVIIFLTMFALSSCAQNADITFNNSNKKICNSSLVQYDTTVDTTTVEKTVKRANIVVVATVLESSAYIDQASVRTVSKVRVDRSIKGPYKEGDELIISTDGGFVPLKEYIADAKKQEGWEKLMSAMKITEADLEKNEYVYQASPDTLSIEPAGKYVFMLTQEVELQRECFGQMQERCYVTAGFEYGTILLNSEYAYANDLALRDKASSYKEHGTGKDAIVYKSEDIIKTIEGYAK